MATAKLQIFGRRRLDSRYPFAEGRHSSRQPGRLVHLISRRAASGHCSTQRPGISFTGNWQFSVGQFRKLLCSIA